MPGMCWSSQGSRTSRARRLIVRVGLARQMGKLDRALVPTSRHGHRQLRSDIGWHWGGVRVIPGEVQLCLLDTILSRRVGQRLKYTLRLSPTREGRDLGVECGRHRDKCRQCWISNLPIVPTAQFALQVDCWSVEDAPRAFRSPIASGLFI